MGGGSGAEPRCCAAASSCRIPAITDRPKSRSKLSSSSMTCSCPSERPNSTKKYGKFGGTLPRSPCVPELSQLNSPNHMPYRPTRLILSCIGHRFSAYLLFLDKVTHINASRAHPQQLRALFRRRRDHSLVGKLQTGIQLDPP